MTICFRGESSKHLAQNVCLPSSVSMKGMMKSGIDNVNVNAQYLSKHKSCNKVTTAAP